MVKSCCGGRDLTEANEALFALCFMFVSYLVRLFQVVIPKAALVPFGFWYSCSRKGLPLHNSEIKVLATAFIYGGKEYKTLQSAAGGMLLFPACPDTQLPNTEIAGARCPSIRQSIHLSVHPLFSWHSQNAKAVRFDSTLLGEKLVQDGGGSVQLCSGTAHCAVGISPLWVAAALPLLLFVG